MTILSDDQIKYAKYKWEFLRRNPEYIKEWEKLQSTLEERNGDLMGPPTGEVSIEEQAFCYKWKIGFQWPPETSYDDFTKHTIPHKEMDAKGIDYVCLPYAVNEQTLTRLGFDVHRMMFDSLFPEFSHWRPFTVMDGWEYELVEDKIYHHVSEEIAKSGNLTIRIDLNHSKNRLINDFKHFVDKWKKLYESAFINFLYYNFCNEREIRSHPIVDEGLQKDFEEIYADRLKERKEKYEKKYHFDNFDLYLQVYDLRQEGMSWAKIENELKLNSVQTARNHYNAACELIEKGIELYVK